MKKLLFLAIGLCGLTGTVNSQSLNFDGNSDFVFAGNVLNASYTKEAWVNTNSNAGLQNIISGGADGAHALYLNAGVLTAGQASNFSAVTDVSTLTTGTWYHIALTYDAGTQEMILYKNGVLISQATGVPNVTGGGGVRLGVYGGTSNYFNGNLDEIRIWNTVRTPAEIAGNMNCSLTAQAGLVVNYNCNQGTANGNNTGITSLTDNSGNANNGTFNTFALTGTTSNFVGDVNLPGVNISGTTTICSGNSTVLTASNATTYTWSANAGSATTSTVSVSPGTTDTYTVTGTNGSCVTTKTITVTVNTTPTVNISGTNAICSGNSTILTASGASTFTWSSNAASATTSTVSVSPGSSDTYTVSGTTSGCTSTKTYAVSVTATPTVNIGGTTTICSGNSTILTASGASTFTWSANAGSATTATVSLNATGVYTVTGDNGGGCTSTKIATVTVNALPNVTISGTSTICNGSGTVLTGNGADTFTWTSGPSTASNTVSPTSNTTYTVTGTTTSTGCSNTATQLVTVNNLPNVTISGTSTICNGSGTVLTGNGADTFTWTSGPSTASNTVSPTSNTTYTVTGTETATGCTNTATQLVTVNNLPNVTISGTSTICNGQSTTLTGNGADTFTWTSGPSTASNMVSPTSNTTYTVTGTETATGCTNTATQLVTVNSLPVVTTNGTATNPSGCGLTDGSVTGFTVTGTPVLQYSWNGGTSQATPDITNIGAGAYSLVITDGNNCTLNAGTFVLSDPGAPASPTVSVSSAAVCAGGSFTLTINSPNGSATYSWTGPGGAIGTGTVITVSNATTADNGNYTAQINVSGCTNSSAPTMVTVNALPNVTISGTSTICNGASTVLTGNGADTYTWTSGPSTATNTVSPTSNTTYTVTGTTTATGCENTATQLVTVNAAIDVSTSSVGPVITATESSATYQWIDCNNGSAIIVGETAQSYTAMTNGDYAVIVTVGSCSDTSACVNINSMGMNGAFTGNISLFPNPGTGIFTILASGNTTGMAYEVMDLKGSVVLKANLSGARTMINLMNMENGMYLLRVNNQFIKLLKQD